MSSREWSLGRACTDERPQKERSQEERPQEERIAVHRMWTPYEFLLSESYEDVSVVGAKEFLWRGALACALIFHPTSFARQLRCNSFPRVIFVASRG